MIQFLRRLKAKLVGYNLRHCESILTSYIRRKIKKIRQIISLTRFLQFMLKTTFGCVGLIKLSFISEEFRAISQGVPFWRNIIFWHNRPHRVLHIQWLITLHMVNKKWNTPCSVARRLRIDHIYLVISRNYTILISVESLFSGLKLETTRIKFWSHLLGGNLKGRDQQDHLHILRHSRTI